MRAWLAISGGLFVVWAAVLLVRPELVLAAPQAEHHATTVALVAAANLVLAGLAWWSASDPPRKRLGIYTTILVLLAKWIADTYGVLIALPPQQAALVLGDLLLSVALVVGCLEALPRIYGVAQAD